MHNFFIFFTIALIAVTMVMLVIVFKGPKVYDRFMGISVIGTNIILVLILIGFIDGRRDMYVDIAISYAILGFFSSIIVAKFLGNKAGKGGRRRGN